MAARGENWGERALRELFGSSARAKVLAWIFAHPASPIVGAELSRDLGLAPTAVARELNRLEGLGMLRAGRLGRAKPYHLNENFPLSPGLRSIVLYATGVVALLRARLADEAGVDVAFVFGSVAARDDRPESDVDLLVVGDVPAPRLATLLREVENAGRREVSQVLCSRKELAARSGQGGSFLANVLAGPKVFVKGDEDALRGLAG